MKRLLQFRLMALLFAMLCSSGFMFAATIVFDFVNYNYDMTRSSLSYLPQNHAIQNGKATIKLTNNASSNDTNWRLWTDGLRVTKSATGIMAISVENATITGISLDVTKATEIKVGNESTPTSVSGGNTFSKTNLSTDELVLSFVQTGTTAIKTITITYTTKAAKQSAELSFSEEDVVCNVGQTAPVTFSNPHNLAVTFTSTDNEVATCVNGVITGHKVGSCVISATSEANSTYEAGLATVNVTVEDPNAIGPITCDKTAGEYDNGTVLTFNCPRAAYISYSVNNGTAVSADADQISYTLDIANGSNQSIKVEAMDEEANVIDETFVFTIATPEDIVISATNYDGNLVLKKGNTFTLSCNGADQIYYQLVGSETTENTVNLTQEEPTVTITATENATLTAHGLRAGVVGNNTSVKVNAYDYLVEINADHVTIGYNEETISFTNEGLEFKVFATKNGGVQFNNGNSSSKGQHGIVVSKNIHNATIGGIVFNIASGINGYKIYGSNNAYSAAKDVNDSETAGTELASFDGNSLRQHFVEITEGNWEYVGFYPGASTNKFNSIIFGWNKHNAEVSGNYTFLYEALTESHATNQIAKDTEGNWTANKIVMADNNNHVMPYVVNAKAVEYNRSIKTTNGYHAYYMPFEVAEWESVATSAVEFTGATANNEGVTVDFTELAAGAALEANKVYLIIPKDGAFNLSLSDVEITANPAADYTQSYTAGGYSFTLTGNYNVLENLYSARAFALSGGEFKGVKAGSVLNPFRAYLVIEKQGAVQAPAKVIMRVIGGNGETTAIEDLEVEGESNDAVFYNIQGVRIANPTNGIYVKDGKKVYVK